jgi:hypothetical protein
VENGRIVREVAFEPVSVDTLRKMRSAEIGTANKFTPPSRAQVDELADKLRENVTTCRRYLAECSRNYSILVTLKGAAEAISIAKRGASIDVQVVPLPATTQPDLVFTTRYSYLRRSLTTHYGHETIFVGSGGVWSYRDRAMAATNLHRELTVLLRKQITSPPSRFGEQPPWLYRAKQKINRAMGRYPNTLYDLAAWTVLISTQLN